MRIAPRGTIADNSTEVQHARRAHLCPVKACIPKDLGLPQHEPFAVRAASFVGGHGDESCPPTFVAGANHGASRGKRGQERWL